MLSLDNLNLVPDEKIITALISMMSDVANSLPTKLAATNLLSNFIQGKHKLCKFAIFCENLREILYNLLKNIDLNLDQNNLIQPSEDDCHFESLKSKLFKANLSLNPALNRIKTGLKLFSVLTITDDCTRQLIFKDGDQQNELGDVIQHIFESCKKPDLIPISVRKQILYSVLSLSRSSIHLRKILKEVDICKLIITWIKFDFLNNQDLNLDKNQQTHKPEKSVPINSTDTELLITYINISSYLLLEFNPKKQDFIRYGILSWLIQNTNHLDSTIKYKSITALANAAYNSNFETRDLIINIVTWPKLEMLAKSDNKVVIVEVLSLLRNLVVPFDHVNPGNLNKYSVNKGTSTNPLSQSSNNLQKSEAQPAIPGTEAALKAAESEKTKNLASKIDCFIQSHYLGILSLLQVIIEKIKKIENEIYENDLEKMSIKNYSTYTGIPTPFEAYHKNSSSSTNPSSKDSGSTQNSVTMATLFKSNLNLATKQNLSGMKIQTVKIIEWLVNFQHAAEFIIKKDTIILSFLIEGSMLNYPAHQASRSSQSMTSGVSGSGSENFYQISLDNPIFGASILVLCEIYEKTKSDLIRTRLENCMFEILNYGKEAAARNSEIVSENLVKSSEDKTANSADQRKNTPNASNNKTARQNFIDEKLKIMRDLLRKENLLCDKNFNAFSKSDDFIFFDRAKRISKNNLLDKIRDVTKPHSDDTT